MPEPIAVLIPTYNGAAFVAETIESVRRQTVADLHITISDDGSVDDTVAICRSFAARDPRITIESSPERQGWVQNLNSMFDRVSESRFVIVPHDDLLEPEYLERTSQALDDAPDAVVAYSDIIKFGTRSEGIGLQQWGTTRLERLVAFIGGWPNGTPFRGVTRRSVLDAGIRLRPTTNNSFHADTVFIFEILANGPLVRVAEPLYRKRCRDNSASGEWGDGEHTEPSSWLVHTDQVVQVIAGLGLSRRDRRTLLGAVLDRLIRELHFESRADASGRREALSSAIDRCAGVVPGLNGWARARLSYADSLVAHHRGATRAASRLAAAAVKLDPSSAEARLSLAVALGPTDEAVVHTARAVADQPWNPSVRLSACLVYERAGLLEEALTQALAAEALAPMHATPIEFAARITEHLGRGPNSPDRLRGRS